MIEKRFILDEYFEIGSVIIDTHNENIKFKHENKLSMQQCCDLLNELHEENEQLKSEYKVLHTQHRDLQKFVENNIDEHLTQQKLNRQIIKLSGENEQLKKQKERYKRLSEIRNEEINNRILTIKEFIDNCSNEEVKKALKDLFYSEVNEYDLSKKYRKLHEENEQLKQHLANDFNQSNCITVQNAKIKDLERKCDAQYEAIHFYKKENGRLKQEIETLQEQLAHFDIGDVE